MQCDRCENPFLDLLVIRENEEFKDKQIWTYICYNCLSYLNQYYNNVELIKEEWASLK